MQTYMAKNFFKKEFNHEDTKIFAFGKTKVATEALKLRKIHL